MATPTPQTWTLRLKSHKTTVLLHVDPLSPFSELKTHLHTALLETGLRTADGATIAIPASPTAIQLGRPVDVHDSSQGWVLGEWEEAAAAAVDDEDVLIEEEESSGKGKGKGKAVVKGKGKEKEEKGKGKRGAGDCPKGAGFKDGSVLAFRFEGDADADEEDQWEVQLASFEDAYGVVNEGDAGSDSGFEG
jgi:hypothetical protein